MHEGYPVDAARLLLPAYLRWAQVTTYVDDGDMSPISTQKVPCRQSFTNYADNTKRLQGIKYVSQ